MFLFENTQLLLQLCPASTLLHYFGTPKMETVENAAYLVWVWKSRCCILVWTGRNDLQKKWRRPSRSLPDWVFSVTACQDKTVLLGPHIFCNFILFCVGTPLLLSWVPLMMDNVPNQYHSYFAIFALYRLPICFPPPCLSYPHATFNNSSTSLLVHAKKSLVLLSVISIVFFF